MGLLDKLGELVQGAGEELDDAFGGLTSAFQSVGTTILGGVDAQLKQKEGILLQKTGLTEYLPVIYGERRAGGIIVNPPGWASGTKNEFLHLVVAICEGEIEAIDDVYIDNIISTDSKFDGLLNIRKYTGTVAQTVDSVLNTAFPAQWTSTHTLTGVAYVAIRFEWDADAENRAFQGYPQLNFVVRGKKVLDTRGDDQVLYSQNPALCIQDYLTNETYGKGLLISQISEATFEAAATTCEILVTKDTSSSATEQTFQCNGVIDTKDRVIDNVKRLLITCRGMMPYVQGQYELLIEQDESSSFNFNKNNIINGSWTIKGNSKRAKLNRVKVKFFNPAKDYKEDLAISESATFLADDNGLLLETEIEMLYETSYSRALERAETELKKSREGIIVSFVATIEALKVKPGDVVTLTQATAGWVNKNFRVIEMTLLNTGNCAVRLIEHEATVYDRTVSSEQETPPNTTLPDPYFVITPTNFTVNSGDMWLLVLGDGTIITRVRISWTASVDIFIIYYEIEYKKSSDSVYLPGAIAVGRTASETFISNLEDGVLYDFRIRAINGVIARSAYVTVLNHTVIGKTAPPPDVDSLVVQRHADGTREYTWVYSSPPVDHGGFIIRYQSGTGGTWGASTVLPGAELLTKGSRYFESNQLAAGTWTFLIKAVDTTGNESTNATAYEVTLGSPRLGNALANEDAKLLLWPGTVLQARVETDNNVYAETQSAWTDLPSTWDAWTVGWIDDPYLSGVRYTHTSVDLGSSLLFIVALSYTTNATTVVIEERHSPDDSTWTAWAAIIGSSFTDRYIETRITLSIGSGIINLTSYLVTVSAG